MEIYVVCYSKKKTELLF
jgi:hypothetical protein